MAGILVTGGAGFIGAALTAALAGRGDQVIAFDRGDSPALARHRARLPGITFVPGEITEWPHLAAAFLRHRPEAVVHCAAIVGVVAAEASPAATFRVNVEGALSVFAASRLFGARRVINLSTEEIYGPFQAPEIDETHPCAPAGAYGISKFAVEQLARDAAREHGIPILHLRTCWVYGPRLARPRVPKILLDAALAGRPLHLAEGADFRVDHVYIDDLVTGILAALDAPAPRFDAYHIASGAAPTLGEIVAILRDLVPGAALSVGPGNYEFAAGVPVVRKGALAITRAGADLGYRPRFDIRAGLAAWIAARGAGED
jgi:UDP-glucose 4-epimerase